MNFNELFQTLIETVTPEQDEQFMNYIKTRQRHKALQMIYDLRGIKYVDSTIDRNGAHSPSGPDEGAPLWNLTAVYPDDVYSANGLRYYATGEERFDGIAYNIIQLYKGYPNKTVTIYRAIASDDVNKIRPGDWVTTVRAYAKDHGETSLNGKYKIINKTVYARDLFTSGDSWLEYGYHPQAPLPTLKVDRSTKPVTYLPLSSYK